MIFVNFLCVIKSATLRGKPES